MSNGYLKENYNFPRFQRGSNIFQGGGGGGSSSNCQKTALTFSCVFFKSLTYFTVLQRVSNGYLKENYNFPRFQRGSNIFQGGGGGGVQMLVSIETVYPPSESMHDIQVGVCTH